MTEMTFVQHKSKVWNGSVTVNKTIAVTANVTKHIDITMHSMTHKLGIFAVRTERNEF